MKLALSKNSKYILAKMILTGQSLGQCECRMRLLQPLVSIMRLLHLTRKLGSKPLTNRQSRETCKRRRRGNPLGTAYAETNYYC